MTRHDGKRDLQEPYKTLIWSFGRLTAVMRGATESMKKFTAAYNEPAEMTDDDC